jgi:glycogen operon protein
VFHRRRFFHGKAIRGAEAKETTWLDPTGKELSDEAWSNPVARCLGVHWRGGEIDVDEQGETIRGDHILMLFNADHALTIPFTLPESPGDAPWRLLLDTARDVESWEEPGEETPAQTPYQLQPCSMAVFAAAPEVTDAT